MICCWKLGVIAVVGNGVRGNLPSTAYRDDLI